MGEGRLAGVSFSVLHPCIFPKVIVFMQSQFKRVLTTGQCNLKFYVEGGEGSSKVK